VRIISRRALRRFCESRTHDAAGAEKDLATWYKTAKGARWEHFGGLKQTFGSADQVGNCVVFDVGRNCYRVIGRVNYNKGIVYVLRVMDHKEYDKKRWVGTCRCHQPPPKQTGPAKTIRTKQQMAERRRKKRS
jgi:mRNA interferase HigB